MHNNTMNCRNCIFSNKVCGRGFFSRHIFCTRKEESLTSIVYLHMNSLRHVMANNDVNSKDFADVGRILYDLNNFVASDRQALKNTILVSDIMYSSASFTNMKDCCMMSLKDVNSQMLLTYDDSNRYDITILGKDDNLPRRIEIKDNGKDILYLYNYDDIWCDNIYKLINEFSTKINDHYVTSHDNLKRCGITINSNATITFTNTHTILR